jgi:molybdopterin converting factor small subunit
MPKRAGSRRAALEHVGRRCYTRIELAKIEQWIHGMVLTVEFLGHARSLVGSKSLQLEIGDDATYGELLRALTRACPSLSGEIIDAQSGSLTSAYSLMRENLRVVQDLREQPVHGERVTLMFVEAGG